MKPVVFPGSFDPVTNGHLDLILRARDIFGEVRVLVLTNTAKKPLFSIQERVDLLKQALGGQQRISVDSAPGLLVHYLQKNELSVIVRGLRGPADWEHEAANAYFNHHLYPAAHTIFLPSTAQWQFISSSAVKEAWASGGDISAWVPACVKKALEQKHL